MALSPTYDKIRGNQRKNGQIQHVDVECPNQICNGIFENIAALLLVAFTKNRFQILLSISSDFNKSLWMYNLTG